MKTFLIFFVFIELYQLLPAQNPQKLDSLKQVYKNASHDTTRILALSKIAFMYRSKNPDTCIFLSQKILELSEQNNFKKGKVEYWNNLGLAYRYKLDLQKAIHFFEKSLKISKSIKFTRGTLKAQNGIANIYNYQGNHTKALQYYQLNLELQQDINDTKGMSITLSNIGIIQYKERNYEVALEYYHKSLDIDKQNEDAEGVSVNYMNIASVYEQQQKYSQALSAYQKALKIASNSHNKYTIFSILLNIGNIYKKQKQYSKAHTSFRKALAIYEAQVYKWKSIHTLVGVASIYKDQGKLDKALKYAQEAMNRAKVDNSITAIASVAQMMYEIYKEKQLFGKSLKYYELHKEMEDSIFNMNKAKEIANLESKLEVLQKDKQIEVLESSKVVLEKENTLEKSYRFWMTIGLIIGGFMLSYIFYLMKKEQKAKKVITELNTNLEKKVQERTESLAKRNERLEAYANYNSHVLRAPIVRLLGLTTLLFDTNFSEEEKQEFLRHIYNSSALLDDVSRHMQKLLNSEDENEIQELIQKEFEMNQEIL